MTYRDELAKKTSYQLYCMLSHSPWADGDMEKADKQLFEAVAESDIDDESYKEALVDLIERLHDDDLL